METLLKLKVLADLFGQNNDDNDEDSSGLAGLIRRNSDHDDGGKAAIRLLYDSSRQWMFLVADNMKRGIIRDDENIECLPEAIEPKLPEEETWNFQLGDTVTIQYSKEDFKHIQQKTLGWNARLYQIHGCVGVVNNTASKYDNSIGVYFPDQYSGCILYAGLLKKTESPEYSNLNPQWKVGDFVQTISCKKTLKLLQRGLDEVPKELTGVKGRVVAVTHLCILVTFDERRTYDLNSASLIPCNDTSPIIKEVVKHPLGFEVGDKVGVKSNVKMLIKNQKKFGGWQSAMCRVIGRKATVIHIQTDGSLIVQAKNSSDWRLNPDSVLRSDQFPEDEPKDEDLKFRPGDVIKIEAPENAFQILTMANVPMIFLEYIQSTAVVALVDDDLDYLVRFNAEQNVQTDENLMRKATEKEQQKYESIEKKVKELKAGDKVHLDIGPPTYVQAMIRELHLPPAVALAMVKSATLIGFVDPYTAIIKYDNGKRFRVKKKYLTVPEKFEIDQIKSSVAPGIKPRIYEAIAQSVQNIHSEKTYAEDWKVMFKCFGIPPCLECTIESTVATFDMVFTWFDQLPEWNAKVLSGGQFLLQGATETEIKAIITFSNEADVCDEPLKNDDTISPAKENPRKKVSESTNLDNELTQEGPRDSYYKRAASRTLAGPIQDTGEDNRQRVEQEYTDENGQKVEHDDDDDNRQRTEQPHVTSAEDVIRKVEEHLVFLRYVTGSNQTPAQNITNVFSDCTVEKVITTFN